MYEKAEKAIKAKSNVLLKIFEKADGKPGYPVVSEPLNDDLKLKWSYYQSVLFRLEREGMISSLGTFGDFTNVTITPKGIKKVEKLKSAPAQQEIN